MLPLIIAAAWVAIALVVGLLLGAYLAARGAPEISPSESTDVQAADETPPDEAEPYAM